MAERLTRKQMAEKYPDQSIGITNIKKIEKSEAKASYIK